MAITKVTTDVITDLAVTAPKLAADSVITSKIADNAVTAAKIAAGALGDQVAGISSSASATTIAGTLASTGVLTANAGVVVDNITIDGSTITVGSANDLTVDAVGDIILDAAGGDIRLKNAGNTAADLKIGDATDPSLTLDVAGAVILDPAGGEIKLARDGTVFANHYGSSDNYYIYQPVNDKDIIFQGTDNSSTITALTLDMSNAGTATFNNYVIAGATNDARVYFNASSGYSPRLQSSTNDLSIYTNNEARVTILNDGKVGINASTGTAPAALFTVKGSADSYAGGLRLEGYNETTALGIAHVDGDNFISGNATNDHITLKANGSVGIGATNNDLRASLTGSVLPNKTLQVGYGQISSDHTSYNYNTNFTNNAYQSGNNATFSAMTSRGAGVIQLLENMFIFTSASGGTAGQQLSLTERMRIDSSGNLGIGTASVPINASTGTAPLYLTMHKDAGNIIEMSADTAGSGDIIGGIDFTNDNNADASNNDADGKLVALVRALSYTDDSNSSDDSGAVLQFATKEHGNVLAERMKINQTGEVQIKGQYNSSGNSQFAYKTVFYQFDMDSGGTHYLQVPLYSSYSSSNSSGWAEMDIAWFPDHASHTHLHSYKFMWGSDHTRIMNLGVISATANETTASYGPYNITSKSELFRHPTAGENNMTYLYIKMQGYHAVNKRRVITLRGVATANDVASIGPVIDHGSTEPVANMVSVNAEIESA